MTGSRIRLTEDEQMIDTKNLRFWMSPHEECALEEAVRIAKARTDAGEACITKVLTLGPADAAEAADLQHLTGPVAPSAGTSGYRAGR